MSRNKAQTRLELVDPCLIDQRGWPCANIRVEATAAAVDIPAEMLDFIDAKGQEADAALSRLRDLVGQQTPKSNVSLKHP